MINSRLWVIEEVKDAGWVAKTGVFRQDGRKDVIARVTNSGASYMVQCAFWPPRGWQYAGPERTPGALPIDLEFVHIGNNWHDVETHIDMLIEQLQAAYAEAALDGRCISTGTLTGRWP